MEDHRFAALVRALTWSRRAVVGGALGLGALTWPGWLDARKKRRRKNKKVKRNAFGCVDVGKFCKNDGQCCSGICQGKKDKKKCKAHDQSTCLGQDACAAPEVDCVTATGASGDCFVTTGKASFCGTDGDCFACTKDADCIPFCGPQAACIACVTCADEVGTDTACLSGSATPCEFPL